MRYHQTVILKNGKECLLRNGTAEDGQIVYDIFRRTHEQTEDLLTYSDETGFDVEEERIFLQNQTNSSNSIEICAFVDGVLAGTGGISPVGSVEKVRHRAEYGVALDRAFWGMGIGKALTSACIQCAREAGYSQLELDVVGSNEKTISLYKKLGFLEFGRNPRGFRTRSGVWQELVLMRLEL